MQYQHEASPSRVRSESNPWQGQPAKDISGIHKPDYLFCLDIILAIKHFHPTNPLPNAKSQPIQSFSIDVLHLGKEPASTDDNTDNPSRGSPSKVGEGVGSSTRFDGGRSSRSSCSDCRTGSRSRAGNDTAPNEWFSFQGHKVKGKGIETYPEEEAPEAADPDMDEPDMEAIDEPDMDIDEPDIEAMDEPDMDMEEPDMEAEALKPSLSAYTLSPRVEGIQTYPEAEELPPPVIPATADPASDVASPTTLPPTPPTAEVTPPAADAAATFSSAKEIRHEITESKNEDE